MTIESTDLIEAVRDYNKQEPVRNIAAEVLILREKLAHIKRRTDALKVNHPEWENIIDAAVHPEDFEL